MPTQTTLARVESFPFDSRADGYDEDGYPVYDRAVGATLLRSTFAKFFSDGVFPSPGTALQISKGAGLTVTIQPGIFIINGAMGGYLTDAHSVTLDTAAPQGNVAYGIMLRYDETEQHRSCYLRVVRGDAASTPQPPAPDQSTPGVMEYRLGHVTVPSGATDLSGATVTSEKGSSVCPFAAPFEKIDMTGVTADARAAAQEALNQLAAYIETNKGLVESALDGTAAGYLQQQINELSSQISEIDLADSVDNVTIEYTNDSTSASNKLRVKDGAVSTGKIAEMAVTGEKLSAELQVKLGLVDTTGWGFDQYYSFTQNLSSADDRSTFAETVPASQLNAWTAQQVAQYVALVPGAEQKKLFGKMNLGDRSWPEWATMEAGADATGRSAFLGKQKNLTVGTFGSVNMKCVSVDHYDGTTGLVFMSCKPIGSTKFYPNHDSFVPYVDSTLFDYIDETILPQVQASGVGPYLKPCSISYYSESQGSTWITDEVTKSVFAPSVPEIGNADELVPDGERFAAFAGGDYGGISYISDSNNTGWTRSRAKVMSAVQLYNGNGGNGFFDTHMDNSRRVWVCFCI